MQLKTTRAFRTISEAGEELELQPHVLRFWESKFPQIKPMKRGGGRRFYRPEDIEFLRGIKVLLHDEKHPIKDVQKLIRVKGANRVIELGRSVEQAAKPKAVRDVELIPERISSVEPAASRKSGSSKSDSSVLETSVDDEIIRPITARGATTAKAATSAGTKITPVVHKAAPSEVQTIPAVDDAVSTKYEYIEEEVSIDEVGADDIVISEAVSEPARPNVDVAALEDALSRLTALRGRWDKFKASVAE